jgi:hypothetical protein
MMERDSRRPCEPFTNILTRKEDEKKTNSLKIKDSKEDEKKNSSFIY